VKHDHRFNTETDKPMFGHIDVCHVWLRWYERYYGDEKIPETMSVVRLDGQ